MNSLRAIWNWLDERTGITDLVKPMLEHLVPPGSKWWYVFGSATLFAFIVQVVTGIALATVYTPSAGQAYASVKFITEVAPWGRLVRGMHYFGASGMIILAVIHMTRVFLMAAYKYPREVNWLSGVVLLALTVVMGFTGQLLRWDQNAIWTAVVGAAQAARLPVLGPWLVQGFLSGDTVSSATLGHFFALHVFILPGLLIAVVGLHLHLVLRNGISEPPRVGDPVDPRSCRANYDAMLKREGVPFWPNAAWRDLMFGFLVMTGIVVVAWMYGPPPAGGQPDPSILEAQPRPDWYLLWYFAVLALVPHHAEDFVIILAPVVAGLVLIVVPFISNRGERHWRKRPLAVISVLFAAMCIGALGRIGAQAKWTPDFEAKPVPPEIIGATTGPVNAGGVVFNTRGCLYCHAISGYGGTRGPDLTRVGDRLVRDQLVIRILNGGYDMPAYAKILTPAEMDDVVAFLQTRQEK